MKTFIEFVENRFDNVNLGAKSIPETVKRWRMQMAQNLQDMVDEQELAPDMTLEQVIQFLRS